MPGPWGPKAEGVEGLEGLGGVVAKRGTVRCSKKPYGLLHVLLRGTTEARGTELEPVATVECLYNLQFTFLQVRILCALPSLTLLQAVLCASLQLRFADWKL